MGQRPMSKPDVTISCKILNKQTLADLLFKEGCPDIISMISPFQLSFTDKYFKQV